MTYSFAWISITKGTKTSFEFKQWVLIFWDLSDIILNTQRDTHARGGSKSPFWEAKFENFPNFLPFLPFSPISPKMWLKISNFPIFYSFWEGKFPLPPLDLPLAHAQPAKNFSQPFFLICQKFNYTFKLWKKCV